MSTHKKKKFTLKHRFQYWFDNLMTGGLLPIIVILATFAMTLTFIFAIIVELARIYQLDAEGKATPVAAFGEAFWQIFMHVIDQGTITGEYGWEYRAVMLIPTLFGLMLVATLIGLVSSRINLFLIDLRKGRSLVIESNHIVILGWSSKIFPIINELVKANENQKHSCIVILAQKDKIEMEDEIKEKINSRGRTRIVCRTGNPIDLDDLEIVNPHEAKSIIIVSPDDLNSDSQNIKCILAIVNHPNRKKEFYHIVAEIHTDKHKEIANIIGGDELTLVISNDVIARIAVQTCLQSGLSVIYNKLLDFSSVEVYMHTIKEFDGKTFKETLMAYNETVVMGIQRANTGIILLAPKMDTKVKEGDKLIILAEDDDALPKPDFSPPTIQEEAIASDEGSIAHLKRPRKVLIIGWNNQGATIVRELNSYVKAGSELCIMIEETADVEVEINELTQLYDFDNITIQVLEGDTTNRKVLNEMNVHLFDNIMLLSYSDKLPIQEADANTLVTLMHLRDIKTQRKAHFTIVSEMLDIKNQTLAEIAKPDDFIISDQVISLIISQLAENKELNFVFTELFDSHGVELYLKPATLYVKSNASVNFYTVIESASRRKEVAVGYRLNTNANNAKENYGICLNPHKSDFVSFSEDDKIIVLAEDW